MSEIKHPSRRDFLKGVAGISTGIAISSLLSGCRPSKPEVQSIPETDQNAVSPPPSPDTSAPPVPNGSTEQIIMTVETSTSEIDVELPLADVHFVRQLLDARGAEVLKSNLTYMDIPVDLKIQKEENKYVIPGGTGEIQEDKQYELVFADPTNEDDSLIITSGTADEVKDKIAEYSDKESVVYSKKSNSQIPEDEMSDNEFLGQAAYVPDSKTYDSIWSDVLASFRAELEQHPERSYPIGDETISATDLTPKQIERYLMEQEHQHRLFLDYAIIAVSADEIVTDIDKNYQDMDGEKVIDNELISVLPKDGELTVNENKSLFACQGSLNGQEVQLIFVSTYHEFFDQIPPNARKTKITVSSFRDSLEYKRTITLPLRDFPFQFGALPEDFNLLK